MRELKIQLWQTHLYIIVIHVFPLTLVHRMYGSYTDVSGGMASDSYMALTGGVPEDINLRELNMEPDQLHTRVRNALSSGAAVTCSVPVSVALEKHVVLLIIQNIWKIERFCSIKYMFLNVLYWHVDEQLCVLDLYKLISLFHFRVNLTVNMDLSGDTSIHWLEPSR